MLETKQKYKAYDFHVPFFALAIALFVYYTSVPARTELNKQGYVA